MQHRNSTAGEAFCAIYTFVQFLQPSRGPRLAASASLGLGEEGVLRMQVERRLLALGKLALKVAAGTYALVLSHARCCRIRG